MRTIETPVLIVGGGPVGLALALDLSWRGVESTMIERTDGAVRNPKTGHISIRSMEFFRRWGIVDRIRNCGFPDDYELSMVFCTSLAGHQLAKHYYPPMRDDPQLPFTPERKQRAPQMYSDPIIAAAVRERDDVTVRYRCEFLDFEQDDDKVVSRVRDLESGEEFRIVSRYLAACDGAASPVRRARSAAPWASRCRATPRSTTRSRSISGRKTCFCATTRARPSAISCSAPKAPGAISPWWRARSSGA